jgi:hypothetical protein
LVEKGLIELGSNMKDDPNDRPKNPTPMAGYTYLGQFIDHDLTFDLTPLQLAGKLPPEKTPNFRSAKLDLDQLYGGGPNLSPFLYRQDSPRGEERFLLGVTMPSFDKSRSFEPSPNDLPRNSQGLALTGDPRQDENLILAQLHVAFLKLHNLVIEMPKALDASKHYRAAGSTFDAARRVVTWHYQWVVRHNFLQEILAPEIFEQLPEHERSGGGNDGTDFRIPVEFSLAAYRFGHSMVRDEYFINDTHDNVSLTDLFKLTGAGRSAYPNLPADWVVDWKRFFFVGGGKHSARNSRAIDTRIAQGLHGLPTDLIRLFNVALAPTSAFAVETPALPVRTLLRGARVGLPSGQDVACALGVPALGPDAVAEGPDKEILTKYAYHRNTPLWYYILKEAELCGGGSHLGPAGSKLVADAIMGALLEDRDSYLSVDRTWTPTLPGPTNAKLFGMSHLLRFVIDRSWPPPDPKIFRPPDLRRFAKSSA